VEFCIVGEPMCSLVFWRGVGPRKREQKRDQQRGDQVSRVQRGKVNSGELYARTGGNAGSRREL